MKERILITGGAGYIGSTLTAELLKLGYHVTVFDNFRFGQESLLHLCGDPGLELVRGDIRDYSAFKRVFSRADIIIPLAAIVGAPACRLDPAAAKSINLEAPIEMFRWLSNAQRLLMPTTNSAYGSGDAKNFCDEESPVNPVSEYARWKLDVERAMLEKPNVISFRLATVFGCSPRMRIDLLVNDFVYRALTDGYIVLFESHFKRNFLHVRDVAGAFIHGLRNFETMRGQIYNVGLSQANLSKLELCREIQKQIPGFLFFEAPIGKDPDQRNYIVSNAKIERTGFIPGHSLADGIRELRLALPMLGKEMQKNI